MLVRCRLCVPVIAALAAAPASAHDEILVGRTAAGQLRAEVSFPQPVRLPASIFPGIPGWAFAAPGLSSLAADEPAEDHFTLDPAASVEFVLIGADPGAQVWNAHGTAPLLAGESFPLGAAPFDIHALWNITVGAPGEAFTLSLRLHDAAGIYSDSEPFTIAFTSSRVSVGCRADYDHDFAIAPSDVAAFVNAWMISLTLGVLVGDYDRNGVVNPSDVAAFINDWFAALGADC